jgi:hypothetical protein
MVYSLNDRLPLTQNKQLQRLCQTVSAQNEGRSARISTPFGLWEAGEGMEVRNQMLDVSEEVVSG